MLRKRNRGFSKSQRQRMAIDQMKVSLVELEASANSIGIKVMTAFTAGNNDAMQAFMEAQEIVNRHVRSIYATLSDYEV